MGRIAADLLFQHITGNIAEGEVIRVQGPLVVRNSTARPSAPKS
jgi:DNA-binding LacI/PurR family transcriptional regulator